MNSYVAKTHADSGRSAASHVVRKRRGTEPALQVQGIRREVLVQKNLQELANNCPGAIKTAQFQAMAGHGSVKINPPEFSPHPESKRPAERYLSGSSPSFPAQFARGRKLTPRQEANRQRLLDKRKRRFEQAHLYDTFGKSADELRQMMIDSPPGNKKEYIKRKYVEQNDIEQRAKQIRHRHYVMSLWPEYRDFLVSLRLPISSHDDSELKQSWNLWSRQLKEKFQLKAEESYSKFKEDTFRNSVRDWIADNVVSALKERGYYEDTVLSKESVAPEQWDAEVNLKRAQVDAVLEQANSGVRAAFPGAKIKYRGSLATGWRNYTKSEDGTAQRMNTGSFDADAFIEIPNDIWQVWVNIELVLNQERKRKVDLSALLRRIPFLFRKDYQLPPQVFLNTIFRPLSSAQSRLAQLKGIETKLILALSSIPGYKLEMPGVGDLHFMLQPVDKSVRELKAGNPYPLGEMARAGRKQSELMMDTLKGKHEVSGEDMLFALAPEVQKEITTERHDALRNELRQAVETRNIRKILDLRPRMTETEDNPLKLIVSQYLLMRRKASQDAGR